MLRLDDGKQIKMIYETKSMYKRDREGPKCWNDVIDNLRKKALDGKPRNLAWNKVQQAKFVCTRCVQIKKGTHYIYK